MKKIMIGFITVALIAVMAGCSGPAKTEGTSTNETETAEVLNIKDIPADFPAVYNNLIAKDPTIKDTQKGSDGKTYMVRYETSLTKEEARTFFFENAKGVKFDKDTANEFGYVLEGKDDHYSYTIAVVQIKDGKTNVVASVFN